MLLFSFCCYEDIAKRINKPNQYLSSIDRKIKSEHNLMLCMMIIMIIQVMAIKTSTIITLEDTLNVLNI